MATITIDKAEIQRDGDDVAISGTVDGVEVSIRVWRSHLDTLANKAAKRAYVAAELKKAAPATPAALDLSGAPITL